MRALLVFLLLSFTSLALCKAPIPGFRPPSVPLINMDPWMSIWSPADHLTDVWPQYWSGTIKAFVGLIRVDGTAYRFMGPSGEAGGSLPDPIPQTSVVVYPTQTVYTFSNNHVQLEVTFTTPLLPNDLEMLKPLSYLSFKVSSVDGKSHDVQLYYDNTAEIAVNTVDENVEWARRTLGSLKVMRIGTSAQKIFGVSGDNVGINWGYWYVAADGTDSSMSQCMNDALGTRNSFASSGRLPSSDNNNMPTPAQNGWPVLAVSWSFSVSPSSSVEKLLALAYDDIWSIDFFGLQLRAYWRRNLPDDSWAATSVLLQNGWSAYANTIQKCVDHDASLLASAEAVGGDEYATIIGLAYRQAIGGGKLVWNDARKEPWYFMKEISSDGDLSTVDVIYPASPFFLHQNPYLLDLMLRPLLAYANNETGSSVYNYTDVWAPHHLGYWPIGNILTKQQENMPVEETGNLIVMLASVKNSVGASTIIKRYWPLIQSWGQYLTTALPDPGNQLCTDDFEGPSPHNANLAMKGMVAVGAFAQLCDDYAPKLAPTFHALATKYVSQWMTLANATTHYRLQYNKPDSWSLKYNIAYQYVLSLHNLFPQSVIDKEVSYYLGQQMNTYGVPLDNRAKFTKLDWLSWIAAVGPDQQFQNIFHRIYRFANESPSRVALSDWYQTDSGEMVGFRARTVVGGIWLKLVLSTLN